MGSKAKPIVEALKPGKIGGEPITADLMRDRIIEDPTYRKEMEKLVGKEKVKEILSGK